MTREVDNNTYLKYLLHSLNVDDLKEICRNYNIRGYSRLKKAELIDFITDSLAEEEIADLIKKKELEIISNEIELAIKKINSEDREKIESIKIVNEKKHEVEILFKGFNWENTFFLSINPENIDNPLRDCDCRVGANMGFCSHFWVTFIFSLKQGYFKLSDWTLTNLPDDFEEKIKSIKITSPTTTGEKSSELSLIDKDSPHFKLLQHNRVTIYEGEITEIAEKESDFQGNITIYYLVTVKDAKMGPQLKKSSDKKEEDLFTVDKVLLRLSDNAYDKANVDVGDNITCNGGVDQDSFLGVMLKRVTKFKKLKS
ncbi:MAG: hypothetical protein EU542_05965 [Promethearchaeota archaeon]|nr:MAG: hypothetical protein EU542_05965 [Candidatus Lokiarchaeota archaeon]